MLHDWLQTYFVCVLLILDWVLQSRQCHQSLCSYSAVSYTACSILSSLHMSIYWESTVKVQPHMQQWKVWPEV